MKNIFYPIPQTRKSQIVKFLIEHSSPRTSFFFLIVMAVLLATIGFLINNIAVIIGSMLIAPLLYPLLSAGLGLAISDTQLLLRSITTIFKALFMGVVVSAITTLLFAPVSFDINNSTELLARSVPTLGYVAVAVVAGAAAAYSLSLEDLNERLIGVAVSVALIPPISAIGVGVGRFDLVLARGATLLFITSAFSIIVTSSIIFAMFRFYTERVTTKKMVRKDDKIVRRGSL